MRSFTAWIRSQRAKSPEPVPAYPTLYVRRLEDRRVLNGEPVANPDSFDVAEDGSLSIPATGVLANDTGTGTMTAVKVSNPANGVLTLNADGSFDYTPNDDFFGTDSFTYEVVDDQGTSLAPATVTLNVTEVNDAPDALDDAGFDTDEDTPLTLDPSQLLSNDSAGPGETGQTLSITSVSATSTEGGTVAIVAGQVVYTPPPGFSGADSFTYTITDDGTTNGQPDPLGDTATVTVQVNAVNDPPTAGPDNVTTAEDTPLTFAASDLLVNDGPGAPEESAQNLSVAAVSGASAQGGTVAIVAGQITYTPPTNFVGVDTFTYTLEDDGSPTGQTQGTVTVTVTEVNDDPVALQDDYTTAEDTLLTFNGVDLLLNDEAGPANENGQVLELIGVDATSAAGGTITFVGGIVTYTPPEDFFGVDTFVYTIRDNGTTNGSPDAKTTTGTVQVTVTEVNDEPFADVDDDGSIETDEDTPLDIAVGDLLANDNAGPLESAQNINVTAVSATSANGGTVTLNNGVITYTPPPDFNGVDTFTYTITDDGTTNGQPDPLSAQGTVYVTVNAVNDPPVAVDDNVTATEDEPLVFDADDLLVNDTPGPANESAQAIEVTGVSGTSAENGSVTFVNGQITYTPRDNFNGTDSFTYTVTDSDGATKQATVFVTVNPVNDPPKAVEDSFTMDEDDPLTGTVLGNDIDVDEDPSVNLAPGGLNSIDPATIVVTQGPNHGQVVFASDGTFVYTPTYGYSGTDEFYYTVGDTAGGVSNPAKVSITILPVIDKPHLDPPTLPTFPLPEGSMFQLTLNGALDDPDGSETLVFELDDWDSSWTVTSTNADVIKTVGGYQIVPDGGATTATIQVTLRDNAERTVKIRAVATENGLSGREIDEVSRDIDVTNVEPTITVGNAQVTSEGTVVVEVTVYDPGADQLSFQIEWQDGTTYDSGVFQGGQPRTFEVPHQYFSTPPSVGSSGQIIIAGTVVDDDGGDNSDFGTLTVPGTGISVVRIDTTPQAPPPVAPPRAMPEAPSTDRAIPVVNTRPADSGGTRGEAAQTSEPSLALRVVSPDGEEGEDIDVPVETLRDLPTLFRRLPDGHYRLYLTERGGGQRRLVLDVFLRRGQPVDPEDLRSSSELSSPDGAALPAGADDRAAQLERFWELRGNDDESWPQTYDRAAEVDAQMERFALEGV
jgi:hypothetical protein